MLFLKRMIAEPDKVEPHDVTIAMARAEMNLNMSKAIIAERLKHIMEL